MTAIKLWANNGKFVATVSILAASLYVAAHLPVGWYPHDEGQLGQAAERILEGEIPHRDFDDMYTGGLSYLHALAFWCFAVNSMAMRMVLWLFFVPAAATIYYLAHRVLPPWVAGLVTFLGATVSVPVYAASMPSWYNLFFALFGVGALVRTIETDRRRWIFLAGLCGGCSILIKITGLFFVAASLLFFVYREQLACREKLEIRSEGTAPRSLVSRAYAWSIVAGLFLFGILSLAFLGKSGQALNALHFCLPMMALAAFLVMHEAKLRGSAACGRWGYLLGMLWPFCLGVGLPLFGWIAFYATHGALDDLYRGVLVLPRMRLERGAYPLPIFARFLLAVPLGGMLALGVRKQKISRRQESLIAAGLLVLLLFSGTRVGFILSFHAIRNLTPLVVGMTLGMLAWADLSEIPSRRRQELFLICATALLISLVQYPFSFGIYFFYAAPMVMLLVVHFVMNSPRPPRRAWLVLLLFYLAFSIAHLNGPDPPLNVVWTTTPREMEPLRLARCGLVVSSEEAKCYRELVDVIAGYSAPGATILATPDSPEVYFLADRKNPSGTMYEFFRPDLLTRKQHVLNEIDQQDIRLVVVNCEPPFSDRVSLEIEAEIAERLPHFRSITTHSFGQQQPIDQFHVYWRD